jgi:hypothetical protein
MPGNGQAALLRGVFTADESAHILADFSGPLSPIPEKMPNLFQNHWQSTDELFARLDDAGLEGVLYGLQTLEALAKQRIPVNRIGLDPRISISDKPFSRHRDFGPKALRYVIVASGTVTYRINGGIGITGKHVKYQEEEAVAGDVLALNNWRHFTSMRPVHQSFNGTGTRFPMDFRL